MATNGHTEIRKQKNQNGRCACDENETSTTKARSFTTNRMKKSRKHEWVFHTQEKEREFLPAMVTFADFIEKLVPLFGEELMNLSPIDIMATKLSGFHLLDKNIKIGVLNVIPSSKTKDDFYDATSQIISSLEGLSEGMKSFIVFPTIVFNSELYEFYQENDQTTVNPIDHIQFLSFKRDMTAFLIDVVRKTYFSEYLRMMNRDFYILTELLKGKK